MFKSLLLQVSSYPQSTPVAAIHQAIAIAKLFDGRLDVLAFENEIPMPHNALANALIDVHGMVAAERKKAEENVVSQLQALHQKAEEQQVRFDDKLLRCPTSDIPEITIQHARTRDVSIIPIQKSDGFQSFIAECVIFGAGRPVILLPVIEAPMMAPRFNEIAIAWDASRPAARAIADALPIIKSAKTVRVVTVTSDKPPVQDSLEQLQRYLLDHDVHTLFDHVPANGRPVGEVLKHYIQGHSSDLLVMGAYGHSRFRDFLLGGATKSMVSDPPIPVFLSH